jgi:hypothetical protein
LLLLSEFSYSQNVLIDNSGDTLVAITLPQMDKIYVELIQKDSLLEQAKISRSKELKMRRIITITESNLKSCEDVLKLASERNTYLESEDDKKDVKIKRNRKIAMVSILFAVLEAFIIISI